MTTSNHQTPTPFEDPLREVMELARRINRRLGERFQPSTAVASAQPTVEPADGTQADGTPDGAPPPAQA